LLVAAVSLGAIGLAAIYLAAFARIEADRAERSRVDTVFRQAVRGQSEASIVAKLGPPDKAEACGTHLSWDGDTENPRPNNGSCVKWARYDFFLTAWAFGYTRDGKLVSRYNYQSE
jgi:hypothetical protein